jgi:hypothetical protein
MLLGPVTGENSLSCRPNCSSLSYRTNPKSDLEPQNKADCALGMKMSAVSQNQPFRPPGLKKLVKFRTASFETQRYQNHEPVRLLLSLLEFNLTFVTRDSLLSVRAASQPDQEEVRIRVTEHSDDL